MAHVIVVGAGTIGSHLLPHVARMPNVTAVTVVDPDCYEPSNLGAQNMYRPDLGKSKAQVQARRLKQIDQSLETRAYQKPVEDLPLGWLRGDVILACLDSRRARMVVNQAAWRLGVPWINAGVAATGLLARVQVFLPAAEAPCLECAWDTRDYELVEQTYACQDGAAPAATGASSGLGALAASIQAIECEKLLSGDHAQLLAGRDVLIDARHHRHYVTAFRRNPACRMPDHAGWRITPFDADPSSTTLGELVATARTLRGADAGVQMGVAGQRVAVTLTCPHCGTRWPTGYVHRGERRHAGRCPDCTTELMATGVDLHDAVSPDALPEIARNRSLTEMGLITGDVVTFTTPEIEVHVELGGAA